MKDGSNSIELISRGVCVIKDSILLCHTKGTDYRYLPGGHVNFGEKAADSLVREISEELGASSSVDRFLGSIEHKFVQNGENKHELNLVFEVKIASIDPSERPEAKEDYIEFEWCRLNDLSSSGLQPAVLLKVLERWRFSDLEIERWISIM